MALRTRQVARVTGGLAALTLMVTGLAACGDSFAADSGAMVFGPQATAKLDALTSQKTTFSFNDNVYFDAHLNDTVGMNTVGWTVKFPNGKSFTHAPNTANGSGDVNDIVVHLVPAGALKSIGAGTYSVRVTSKGTEEASGSFKIK